MWTAVRIRTYPAADAGERVQTAKDRLRRLERGESVAGGLGKRLDVDAAMKAAGFTSRQLKRIALVMSLTKDEFETVLHTNATNAAEIVDKAFDRAARRTIRARNFTPQ